MKEIKRYVCEVCHTEYAVKEKAEKCEKSHVKPISLEDCGYSSYGMDKYPTWVNIGMKDGNIVRYTR